MIPQPQLAVTIDLRPASGPATNSEFPITRFADGSRTAEKPAHPPAFVYWYEIYVRLESGETAVSKRSVSQGSPAGL